jgi:hypothetical protein
MHNVQSILDESIILSPGYHAQNVQLEDVIGWIEGQDMESTGSWPSRPSRNHNLISLTFYLVHIIHIPNMSATIRSLRPLMRTASPAMRRLPVLVGQARSYKQPARDLMTGEVTQLPDIDVS